ncbi:MAG TPA: hypothetical protein VMV93_12525 [Chloroflexota bacterium]|nr:hypothetical protein [Chloroflexota bacterium]
MGEGASGGARKRRRGRGGRGRNQGAEPRPEALDQPGEGLLDIPVERGLPVLYAPLHAAEEDDPEDEGAAPAKGKKLNAGKLFWFIRSKSYVPIPEIRRRFEISAAEMSTIVDGADTLYVGLPEDAASAVATLRRQQKIGIECSPDFSTHVVIGLYPLKRL